MKPTSEPLVYDAGALIAAENDDQQMRLVHKVAAGEGREVIVPTPVLAQAWRDGARQARLARALQGCQLEPPSEATARRAGVLLGRSNTRDAVDALVVAAAVEHRASIVTSDPKDMRCLIDAVPEGHRPDLIDL